jgi:hypothetical protein
MSDSKHQSPRSEEAGWLPGKGERSLERLIEAAKAYRAVVRAAQSHLIPNASEALCHATEEYEAQECPNSVRGHSLGWQRYGCRCDFCGAQPIIVAKPA